MHTWFRFTGRVWEDLSFEPDVGWETDVVAHRPVEGDGTWTLELLDGRGQVVVDVHPDVRFDGAAGSSGRMRVARVVAYMPVHPRGRRVRLRRRDHVVHERELAEVPPRVRITRCAVDEDRHVTLAWTTEGADAAGLTFRVVYVAEGRGVFPLARDLTVGTIRLPLARLPGCPGGRLAVLASDGLRSSFDVSEPFVVPARPARVAILEPEPRSVHPYGQPVTLRGVAHDDAGQLLDAVGFVWTLDGVPVAHEAHLALATDLRPGEHTIVLAWEGAGAPRAETRVQFVVERLARPDEPRPRPAVEARPTGDAPTTATIRLRP